MPDEPEALGLLALMLLHDSRGATRASTRTARSSCWRTRTARGGTRTRSPRARTLVDRALRLRRARPVPAPGGDRGAPRRADGDADWPQIVALYGELAALHAVAGRRAQPRGGGGDGRRAGARPRADRRDRRARRLRARSTRRGPISCAGSTAADAAARTSAPGARPTARSGLPRAPARRSPPRAFRGIARDSPLERHRRDDRRASNSPTCTAAPPIIAVAEPQFVRFDDVKAFELVAGVTGRPLFGAGAMINLIEFEPGAVVPLHSHPHEQLGIVLRGMQALVVDGDAARARPDGGLCPSRAASSTPPTAAPRARS